MKQFLFSIIILTAFIVGACGAPVVEAVKGPPAFLNASLTDVNSGNTFTIQDLKGKVILVEAMAVWCTNCFKQQTQVKQLHAQLGSNDEVVSISLDVDSNEDTAKLKDFSTAKGFDWTYAISPADVSRELASLYGDQFLNPTSTPMLVIDRQGNVHVLPFGVKSADDLMKFIQPFLDAST